MLIQPGPDFKRMLRVKLTATALERRRSMPCSLS
jgi:hypothetical protein